MDHEMREEDPEYVDLGDDDSEDSEYIASDDSDDEVEIVEPGHAEHKESGNKCYKSKDYRGAIAHYTLAIAAATDASPAVEGSVLASYHSNRAAAFSMILQYEKTIEDCDAAVAADPTFSKAFFRKARTLTTLGRLDEAVRAYSFGSVRDPNDAAVVKDKDEVRRLKQRYELASSLAKKYDDSNIGKKDAAQIFRQTEVVLASCPAWSDALFLKATALYHLHRAEDAYAVTTTLVRTGGASDHDALVLLRARVLFRMGNVDDSLKHLRQILAGDPDNKRAFAALKRLKRLAKSKETADAAYKARDYDGAERGYGEALSSSDDLETDSPAYAARLRFNRASARAALRRHDGVVEDCDRAVALDSTYLKAIARRAASLLLRGGEEDCARAVRDYERAAELAVDDRQKRDFAEKVRAARVQLKRSKQKDLYKILNVARDADDSEIKKGYRRLALKWHPDRHANSSDKEKEEAERIFRDVNLAYEVLSDPTKKRRYDDGVDEQDLDNPHATAGGGCHGGGMSGMGGMDPNVLFEMFMRQQGGGGGGGMGGGGRRRGGGGHSFHFG